jgi:hypothetical protein
MIWFSLAFAAIPTLSAHRERLIPPSSNYATISNAARTPHPLALYSDVLPNDVLHKAFHNGFSFVSFQIIGNRNTERVGGTEITTSQNLNLQSPPQSPLSGVATALEKVHQQRNGRYY